MPEIQAPEREFDKIVQVRDKHGNLVSENHYAYHIIDGSPYFERPIGSGNLFYPNGDPAGRMKKREVILEGPESAHLEYVAPLTGAAKAEQDLNVERAKNAELIRELEALKLEAAKEAAAQKKVDEAKAASKFGAHLKEE